MRIMTVKMVWVESENKWRMIAPNGFFLYDFFDCENVNKFFETLAKDKEKHFEITCREVKA